MARQQNSSKSTQSTSSLRRWTTISLVTASLRSRCPTSYEDACSQLHPGAPPMIHDLPTTAHSKHVAARVQSAASPSRELPATSSAESDRRILAIKSPLLSRLHQEPPNNAMDLTATSLAFGSVGAAAHRQDVSFQRSSCNWQS